MIYEDTYTFLLNKCSSKEIDIVLYIINNTNWNNIIEADFYDIAKKTNTTKKYVKQIFKKFNSLFKGKKILSASKTKDNSYTVLLGKSSLFYSKGDKYGKKYAFLYTKKFQDLSLYAKRILLKAAMDVSLTNSKTLYLPVNYFVYRNEMTSGHIPSKNVLANTLEEINNVFKDELKVALTSTILTKQESIFVEFNVNILENTLHNHTERSELKKVLFKSGFFEVLTENQYIEIEKVGKYVFNSLLEHATKINKGLSDDMLDIARYVYRKSLADLARSLHSFLDNEKEEGELAAYFSAIVFSNMSNELAKQENQYNMLDSLIKKIKGLFTDKNNEKEKAQSVMGILKNWVEDWAFSRCQKEKEESYAANHKKVERNKELKHSINNILERTEIEMIKYSLNHNEIKVSLISSLRKQVTEYIDILNKRLMERPVAL